MLADRDPSPEQCARDARAAQRAEVTAVRNEAAALRQRSLQEVLVQRTADRPDVPAHAKHFSPNHCRKSPPE